MYLHARVTTHRHVPGYRFAGVYDRKKVVRAGTLGSIAAGSGRPLMRLMATLAVGIWCILSVDAQPATDALRAQFQQPPTRANVYVYWHWMGSNFSKEGITKDLEAMKATGIGGAVIFNLTSAVQETQSPTQNNPWPDQTYRSPAYWEALKHAAAEAQRLGIDLGLHNSAGYSTTGGPWITEDRAMQQLVWTRTQLSGGKLLNTLLPEPEKPIYKGWGSLGAPLIQATRFTDIVVLAVPAGRTPAVREVVNLTANMSKEGQLQWQAPAGDWTVYRIGYSPTMAVSHPLPDELIGKSLEVNKIDADQSRFHWQNVLEPLKKNLGPYLGKSFSHILIDSYEAGSQNWTPTLQREFINRKGYDPLPWLLCLTPDPNSTSKPAQPLLLENQAMTQRFLWDYRDVISQLYYENGWAVARQMVHQAGLNLHMEPYSGPFSTIDGAALADLPMGEFWTSNYPWNLNNPVPPAARAAGKTLIGAEAYTGRPEVSQWTEDPAFLKPSGDLAFVGGVNRLVLHHWVLQPFDDRYQPGMGMGWWGTHFSRHQTWAEPGKAFFTYLNRCQTLLQAGQQVVDYLCVDKLVGNADLISVREFMKSNIRITNGQIVLPSGRTYPFIVFPNSTEMSLAVARKIETLVAAGATVVGAKPVTTPGLVGYPASEDSLRKLVDTVWGPDTTAHVYGQGKVLPSIAEALRNARVTPDVVIEQAIDEKSIRSNHRRTQKEDLYFVVNQAQKSQRIRVSFRVAGKQPELWLAEDGSVQPAAVWQEKDGRTSVLLSLKPLQSVFVVFRKNAPVADHPVAVRVADTTAVWTTAISKAGKPVLQATTSLSAEVLYASGKTAIKTLKGQQPTYLTGAWKVTFRPKVDQPFALTFPKLVDFSQHGNPAVRYFAGAATYQQTLTIAPEDRKANQRILLDLGELNDMAEVRVNGIKLGVLWYPPYQMDLTDVLKTGKNELAIVVTNNWANRMIGDEQEPVDFEWGQDRGDKGRAIKGYPDWFIQQKPRPSAGRKAFTIWYYHRKDSPLQPAGLVGPVQLRFSQSTEL